MPTQPRHVRTINGKRVAVNPNMPPPGGRKSAAPTGRPAKAAAAGLAALAGDNGAPGDDFHIADLRDWGLDVDFVSDDDGGGVVFNRESYLPEPISVLDAAAENKLESDLTGLARDAGLGGVEVLGNRLQWIKVYDAEGHPIGQDGYVSEGTLDALEAFDDHLRGYGPPPGGRER